MDYISKYNHWLNSANIDDETKNELIALKDNDKEIKERFFCEIEFGTAGMRGVLGAGLNRMNKYMVRRATEGYAKYILDCGDEAANRGVVIAHDNRRFSVEFSRETAAVLAPNLTSRLPILFIGQQARSFFGKDFI